MTAKVLHGYSGLGQQNSAGVFEDNGGDIASIIGAEPMADAALASNDDVDPQGVEFEVAIRAADQTTDELRQHYEYAVMSYDLSNEVYTWNRARTIRSSNNGSAIDWSTIVTGNNSLQFYATATHEQFKKIEAWHVAGNAGEPALQNSWQPLGVARAPKFRINSDGKVTVKGIVTGGTSISAEILVLPIGYRPPATETFNVNTNSGSARIDVNSSGSIAAISGGSVTYTSLSGISFYID